METVSDKLVRIENRKDTLDKKDMYRIEQDHRNQSKSKQIHEREKVKFDTSAVPSVNSKLVLKNML